MVSLGVAQFRTQTTRLTGEYITVRFNRPGTLRLASEHVGSTSTSISDERQLRRLDKADRHQADRP